MKSGTRKGQRDSDKCHKHDYDKYYNSCQSDKCHFRESYKSSHDYHK